MTMIASSSRNSTYMRCTLCMQGIRMPTIEAARRARPLARQRLASTSASSSSTASAKIQVIPFNLPPSAALGFTRTLAKGFLIRLAYGRWGAIWEIVKSLLGLQSNIPELRILQWKPIYLPHWRIDYAALVKARLSGHEYTIDFKSIDMPFPGTRTNPLGSATIPLPKNEEMAALLESFDPEKHLSVYRDERVEIEGDELDPDPVPPAVAIPFDIFPKGLSEAMASVISGIRDEEVRFPGELETVMVAAYPVYAPYYLTELEHVKTGQDEDAPTTNERITALLYGRQQLLHTVSFWQPGRTSWRPSYPVSLDLRLGVVPKIFSRLIRRSSTEAEGEDSSFRSISPSKSIGAAIRAGAIDGAPPSGSSSSDNLSLAQVQSLTQRAGNLLRDVFFQIIQKTVEASSIDIPAKAPSDASPFSRVNAYIQEQPNYVAYKDFYAANRAYLDKLEAIRSATGRVQSVKSMPTLGKDETARAISVGARRRFDIEFKTLNAAEMEATKKMMLERAEQELKRSIADAQQARPSWLVETDVKND